MDMDTKTPVFVLYGALRSGTTLLRLVLDAHPQITCLGERDFMVDHITQEGGALTLDRDGLSDDWIFQESELSVPAERDGQAAFDALLREEQARATGALVLVIHRRLDLVRRLLPDAHFIHLLRDPRDVARSSIGMGWAGNTFYGVDHWIGTERAWERNSHGLPAEAVHTLRYEDMLDAPAAHLGALCAFMGCAYDPAMMSYSETSTYSPLDPALCYQWKRKQTEREVGLVEYKIGAMLEACGYAPSGFDRSPPSVSEKLALWMKNKHRQWSVRMTRFGLKDTVWVVLCNRLALHTLARPAQQRINQKIRAYLK